MAGLKIKSGSIVVTIGETEKNKKLLGVEWRISFDNKKDAKLFFNRIKEIFLPLSTKHKSAFVKDVGHIEQYAARGPNDKGIRDISFVLGRSLETKKYQVSASIITGLMNE